MLRIKEGPGGAKFIYCSENSHMLGMFDRVCAIYDGAVVDRGGTYLRVQPGQVGFNNTTIRFRSGWVYRLTGPRGEVAEGRP
jgi:hypothetical protein